MKTLCLITGLLLANSYALAEPFKAADASAGKALVEKTVSAAMPQASAVMALQFTRVITARLNPQKAW